MRAIILVRVSTDRQEFENQRNELIQMAVADGFSKENLIIIEGEGASARKVDEKYKQEIRELYTTVESDPTIKAVYAWEISRIGRKEVILMQIKDFMIEHKVNIIIKEPSLRLLNYDGSVNNGVELAFSLFATMAKQEMDMKIARAKRTKKANKKEGIWNGGWIKFGYAIDDTNHYIIDPDTGNVVRQIFKMYLEEGATCRSIFNHFHSLGYFPNNVRVIDDMQRISKMLKDRDYLGEGMYPRIIDDDLFEKVNEKKGTHRHRHASSNEHLCKSILYDVKTGIKYCPYKAAVRYCIKIKECPRTLSMNVMDDLVGYVTCLWHLSVVANSDDEKREKLQSLVVENNKKISVVNKQIVDVNKKIDRVIKTHIDHPRFMTKEKLDKELAVYDKIIREKELQIAKMKSDIAEAERLLNETTDDGMLVFHRREFEDLPLEQQYNIVRQTVKRIDSEYVSEGKYILTFTSVLGDTVRFFYNRLKNRVEVLNEMGLDISPILRLKGTPTRHSRSKRKTPASES